MYTNYDACIHVNVLYCLLMSKHIVQELQMYVSINCFEIEIEIEKKVEIDVRMSSAT